MSDTSKKITFGSESMITVNTSQGKKKINTGSITYIRSDGRKVDLYLEDNTSLRASHLLKWFGERLEGDDFSRCHKSYIVNMQKVDYFCYEYLILDNKEWIPVSRRMRDEFNIKQKKKKK